MIQIANDPINRCIEFLEEGHMRPAITFSPLSSALPAITRYVRSDRRTKRRWYEATGCDCASPHEVARLLLRYPARANPGGGVLYFTSRPERLRVAPQDACSPPEGGAQSLDAFLELIEKEIRPLPASTLW